MIIAPTAIAGVHLIDPEPHHDARGFFARMFDDTAFAAAGLATHFTQMNNSLSHQQATLRGLHYQLPPAAEVKLLRCVRGALRDIALDLRPGAGFGQWIAAELTADNRRMIYLPHGVAHGFITLTDDTEALYLTTAAHDPARERGIRWDDPRFRINWARPPASISDKDRSWPDFDPAFHGVGAFAR